MKEVSNLSHEKASKGLLTNWTTNLKAHFEFLYRSVIYVKWNEPVIE